MFLNLFCQKKFNSLLFLLMFMLLSPFAFAECSDYESMMQADKGSKAFLGRDTEIFQRAVVLKRHHPSHQKEVASYAKAGGQYYTMFFIIDNNKRLYSFQ